MTWERRWHPLREEWVTITSHRNQRPWSRPETDEDGDRRSVGDRFDPGCYLCPGNTRVSGLQNPVYTGPYVFDNDHPSFSLNALLPAQSQQPLFRSAPATGICRVICYCPEHNGSLARMTVNATVDVLNLWASQTQELAARTDIDSVVIFENKGEVVGVSNMHPHGQIYAPGFVMDGLRREASVFEQSDQLMTRLLDAERKENSRIVVEGSSTTAYVPYFARFPYEAYVVPHRRYRYLFEMPEAERRDFAATLNELLVRYDNLWETDFPYMMLLHQAPCDREYPEYHLHVQLHPPLRQPGLQKYLAAVETGGDHYLNDGSPEDKAEELRRVGSRHFALRR